MKQPCTTTHNTYIPHTTIHKQRQNMTKVNIQVEEETREKLSSLGKHRETYDDIIVRLMSQNKSQKKEREVIA